MTTDLDKALALLDEILANNQRSIDNLRAILDPPTQKGEPTATADTFAAGDWVRPGTSPVWRQINNCAYCWCGLVKDHRGDPAEHVVVALTGNADTLHLRKYDTLPYLTDAQFDRACRAERDEADDRMLRAERGAA